MATTPDPSRRSLLRSMAAGVCVALAPAASSAEETQIAVSTARVRAAASRWAGAACISVELRDDEQRRVLRTGGNGPTYALVHVPFKEGVIEADVAAEFTGLGAPESRGFVGLAFHIDVPAETYEAVYLRMTNGRLNRPMPPAPRVDRAIQYVAHPDLHYAVLRERFPGRYERGADVALGQWHHLRLEIGAARVRVLVDGHEALAIDELRYPGREGAVGLFIDDGTRGYFRDLRIAEGVL